MVRVDRTSQHVPNRRVDPKKSSVFGVGFRLLFMVNCVAKRVLAGDNGECVETLTVSTTTLRARIQNVVLSCYMRLGDCYI
jgi:hypothetical protein